MARSRHRPKLLTVNQIQWIYRFHRFHRVCFGGGSREPTSLCRSRDHSGLRADRTHRAGPGIRRARAPAPSAAASRPPSGSEATKPKKTLEEVRKEIDALYRKAGAATDAYNLAEEKAEKQSGEIVRLARAIVAGQAKIAELKSQAGAQPASSTAPADCRPAPS